MEYSDSDSDPYYPARSTPGSPKPLTSANDFSSEADSLVTEPSDPSSAFPSIDVRPDLDTSSSTSSSASSLTHDHKSHGAGKPGFIKVKVMLTNLLERLHENTEPIQLMQVTLFLSLRA